MEKLKLPWELYKQIMDTVGSAPAETGGVFAVSGNTVSGYYFDADAGTGKRFYKPTADKIDEIVNMWLREPGQYFGGYIHSHPPGTMELSPMDRVCAEMTIGCNNLPFIYMAILCEGELYLYKIKAAEPGEKHGTMETCTIEIEGYGDLRRIPEDIEFAIRERIAAFEREDKDHVVFQEERKEGRNP